MHQDALARYGGLFFTRPTLALDQTLKSIRSSQTTYIQSKFYSSLTDKGLVTN